MRDPLFWVPIKYKLPLTFLSICLVAFGVGGFVVTSTGRATVEEQIRLRLDEHAAATTIIVERHLDLIGRRIEDFASDGFIRTEFAGLLTGQGPARLKRHLDENKLPLVDAFVDAMLLDPNGEPALWVGARWEPPPGSFQAAATWFGPLRSPTDVHPHPTFLLSTPLRSLDGDARIGTLQLLVRADTWVAGMTELATLPAAGLARVELIDPVGSALPLRAAPEPVPRRSVIPFELPIAKNGWRLELAVDREAAMQPISALHQRYLLTGAVLLLLTACVLFFPVRFLLRPLGSVREAARRIAGGDLSARVGYDSRDEIGDLSRAFDFMARTLDERTRKLEEAAAILKRRQKDIRFERDRLDAVIHSMKDGLFILDTRGRVTLSNAAAKPLVRELAQQKNLAERLRCDDSQGVDSCLACLADTSRPPRSCVIEVDSRVYEVHVTTLPAPDGPVAGRLCVSRDITTRIAETDRQSHQERMSVLGEVAAVMAHELNNPLAAIAMFGQMLESQLAEGSARKGAAVIRRNAETCKRTIRGLLDMAAHAASDVAEFDLAEMLGEVGAFLRPIYSRAGVTFRFEAPEKEALIVGDELQLRQVLINLVMNAIQAMEGGGVVTVSVEDSPDHIRILVRDTGPGIAEGMRAHIFEPFFTTKPPGTGTGLGLPTSRRIVEAHGGALELHATGEKDTAFRIELPRTGSAAAWEARARMTRGVLSLRFPEAAREVMDG